MSDKQFIESLIRMVEKAEADPKLFFGAKPEEELKQCHLLSHPDRHKEEDKKLAQSIFTRFTLAYERLSVKPVVLNLKDRSYALVGRPIIGDTSDVYVGEQIVKVGRLNDLSVRFGRNEADILKKFTDPHFRKYVPTLLESHKQVNVFEKKEDFTVLSELKDVDGRHIAWIFKRILEILGYSHSLGITHGGILPDNILIFKKTHGINLLDWKFAGLKELKKSKKFLTFYPPYDIIGKQTDIYMAVKTVQSIAGKLPVRMNMFFNGCLQPKIKMQPDNAWALNEEFKEVLLRTYGPPKFVEMT